MENKLIFCSECGAKLTGSGTFCSHCGAKQDAAPVATTTDFPAEKIVHSTTVPTPPSAITPKISAGGLVMTLLALGTTFLAIVLYVIAVYKSSRHVTLFWFGDFCLYAWIVPLFAMLMVLTKSKKFAVYGLALALMSLTLQFIASLQLSFMYDNRIISNLFFAGFERPRYFLEYRQFWSR